eukprot:243668-Amphidinium_carterae.1
MTVFCQFCHTEASHLVAKLAMYLSSRPSHGSLDCDNGQSSRSEKPLPIAQVSAVINSARNA